MLFDHEGPMLPLHLMPPAPPGWSHMDFLNMFNEDTLVDKDGALKTLESEEATIPFVCILLSFLHIFIF